MQFLLTPELSAWIAERIRNYYDEDHPNKSNELRNVKAYEALPINFGWWETCGIRATGEIVSWGNEDSDEPFPSVRSVDERGRAIYAVVQGAKRYPQLQELLPPRPGWAVDCECRQWPEKYRDFLCDRCGGLRWVEPGAIQRPD